MYVSRGAGIGQIFSSIYSAVVPIVRKVIGVGAKAASSRLGKQVLKDVKKTASRAGLKVVGDALRGENVLKSTKKAVSAAKKDIGAKLNARGIKAIAAASAPLKRSKKPKKKSGKKIKYGSVKKKIRKKQAVDIFSR